MSLERWENEYRKHEAWRQTQETTRLLDSGPQRTSADEVDHYDRVRWVAAQVADLADNPTLLVSAPALQQLSHALANMNAQLSLWATGGAAQPQALANAANQYLDPVLDLLRSWPATKDRYQRGLLRAGIDFVRDANTELTRVRAEVEAMVATLSQYERRAGEVSGSADEALAELRQAVAQLKAEATLQTTRLDNALNGLQTTFSAAEAERAATFTTALEQAKDAGRETTEGAKAALSLAIDDVLEAGKGRLAEIDEMKAQAENVLGAIGLTGTATEYGLYAKQERTAADRWRLIAMGSFAGSFVLFLVTLLASHVNQHSAWQVVVFKLAGSVALLAAGAYASHESSEHRTEERKAKSIQLDLAALDPFIVNLSPQQRSEIKELAARRLFAGISVPDETDGVRAPMPTDTVKTLVEALTNAAQAINSAAR